MKNYINEFDVSGGKVNGFKATDKEYVVERTFSWFDNCRGV